MHAMLRDATPPLTRSVEDYLKTIYHLSSQGGFASTRDIAGVLRVAPPSVSGMVKRLSETGLIEHVPYRGVQLTAQGRRAALKMIRRHRILEVYLTQHLGYDWGGRLRYFAEQGLTPGVLVTVTERQPFNGPTTISLVPSGDPRVVGRELAQLLLCRAVPVEQHGHPSR